MEKVLALLLVLFVAVSSVYALEDIISSDVDLTPSGTFVNIGNVQKTDYAQKIGLFIETEGQGATDIQLKVLGKDSYNGASDFVIEDLSLASDLTLISTNDTINISTDLTGSRLIILDVKGVVPYVKIQGKCTVAGASGQAKVTSMKIAQTRN